MWKLFEITLVNQLSLYPRVYQQVCATCTSAHMLLRGTEMAKLTTSPILDHPSVIDCKAKVWIQQYVVSNSDHRPPLIDIRPTSDYVTHHIHSSSHFSGLDGPDGLLERMNELPPPQSRHNMAILAPTFEEASNAAQLLDAKGYRDITPLTFQMLPTDLPLQTGLASRSLWHPAPLLVNALSKISQSIPELTALDIGAGSGRDSVFLASKGFVVTAVDRDRALMAKAASLAARHLANQPSTTKTGVVNCTVRTFGADITDDTHFLRSNAAGLLVVVRFLRRSVLNLLWNAILPGGFIVYEHFLEGCERFGGPVKASQMLKSGELRQVFSEARGFTVWHDEQSNLSDGRPIVRFIARRTTDFPI